MAGLSEAVEHDPDGGKGDDSLGGIAAFLIILGQAPSLTQRFEGSFDHPAVRTEDEAATSDATDDEKRQPEQETLGIDGNVTFAALDLLDRAEASRLPFRRLDAFAQGLAGAIIANQPARQAVTPASTCKTNSDHPIGLSSATKLAEDEDL